MVQSKQPHSISPDSHEPSADPEEDLQTLFMYSVSHELRTPLQLIQGYAALLNDGFLGALAPEQMQAIINIVHGASTLRALVEQIGILLAVEAQTSVSVPIALADVVSEVVEGQRTAATQAGLTLVLTLETDLPQICGDPYHLKYVVDCLLDNALKFTPEGGQIEVQVYTEPGLLCLTITDTGIGIEEEVLEHIFDRFHQADNSVTRRYRGLGLGLAVVKAVVEDHGGQIAVSSQPDQGSCFTVKLPIQSSKITTDAEPEHATATWRILIVDDEKNVAEMLLEGLGSLPHCEIAVATSGDQALQIFEQHPFDLLITDYKMPGTDGLALATRIRQQFPQTIIIMITAYGDEALYEMADHDTIQHVMEKPIDLREIRSVTFEALAGSGKEKGR